MKDQASVFLCSKCDKNLTTRVGIIVCPQCGNEEGHIQDEILMFHDASNQEGFFEKQAVERLEKFYSDYSYEKFKESLRAVELDTMDPANKNVGITRKKWWEKHVGLIRNSSILEIGCGINYLVPYWLDCGNQVVAFDICKESVFLLRAALKKIGLDTGHLTLVVGNAEHIRLAKKFDVININNVIHHIADKRKVLSKAREALNENGKILLVEPNYYYPPRWIIETDFMKSINFIKLYVEAYFSKNNLMEKDEKGIIFRELKKMILETGLHIDVNEKDLNFLGYFCYILHTSKFISRSLFLIDHYFLGRLLPAALAPFEYLILSKSQAKVSA